MALPAPPTIDDLGVRGSLYLAALLSAQDQRMAVAATLRTSLAVLELLRELKIIDVPWPLARWAMQPDAEETPLEGLQWRFAWTSHARNQLGPALEEYLQGVPRDDYGLACRLQLWEELAASEAEGYFEFQLAKHRFDTAWARDLVFVHKQSASLSIAQWRYCVWAATRHGGSVAQQQAVSQPGAVREAIYAELRRRVTAVSGGWRDCAFMPHNRLPFNSLGRGFIAHLCPAEFDFWGTPPSLSALLFQRRNAVNG
jgi:hypothetical protein